MSDQDFFFDEEETAVTGTKETAKPSAKSESKAAPAARKPAPKPAGAKPAGAKPATAASAGGSSFFEQSVSITIASLMTVIGLLVGVIIGFLVAPDGGTVSTGAPAATTGAGTTAPQLSEEELSSGALPEGHPDIGSVAPTATTGE